MKRQLLAVSLLLVLGLVFGLAAVAQAEGIAAGGNPQGDFVFTEFGVDSTLITIDDGNGGRQEVSLVPGAAPWRKLLNFAAPPAPFMQVPPAPGTVFTIHELLTVGEGPQWTDWHEVIVDPGWQWGSNLTLHVGVDMAPGLRVSTDPSRTMVDFYFDPLPVGTPVDIWKELIWDAPGQMNWFPPHALLVQHPTPEPSTLAMTASGLMLLAGFAWRRRTRVG